MNTDIVILEAAFRVGVTVFSAALFAGGFATGWLCQNLCQKNFRQTFRNIPKS